MFPQMWESILSDNVYGLQGKATQTICTVFERVCITFRGRVYSYLGMSTTASFILYYITQ